MSAEKRTIDLLAESLPLAIDDRGGGQAFLILHGGAGPASVAGLAGALSKNARAVVPTHPGFDREPRPDWLSSAGDLALAYLALIERLGLSKVVVIGNSFGGWIAAEIALRHSPRIAGIALLNAVGVDPGSDGREIVDPTKVAPAERAALAFFDPARFAILPAGPEGAAVMAANQQTLRVYTGGPLMYDPGLRARLARMPVPALVAWGENDRIVDVDYGRSFAGAMARADFKLIARAGHFPHIEQREEVVALISQFAGGL